MNENGSMNEHSVTSTAHDVSTCLQRRSSTSERGNGKEWWSRFQSEEDWEHFTEMAAQYLSTLISAELADNIQRDRDPWRMKTSSTNSVSVHYGCQRDPYSLAKMWLHRIFQAITSMIGSNPRAIRVNHEIQMKMNYISYLVKELVTVQQRLDTLPPIPALPDGITLGELSEGTRTLLTLNCSAWRAEAVKERELLQLKQSTCREEILSAIIETEEELFWSKDNSKNKLGSYDEDGYFRVVGNTAPCWNDFDDDVYVSKQRCHVGFRYLLALTAGAAGIASFLLQSKRR
jgi:hypothetical protein